MDDRVADLPDQPQANPGQPNGLHASADDLADRWVDVQAFLIREGGVRAQHRPIVNDIRLMAIVEDTALLSAPTDFAKNELEVRMRQHVQDALRSAFGRELTFAVSVASDLPAAESQAPDDRTLDHQRPLAAPGTGRPGLHSVRADDPAPAGADPHDHNAHTGYPEELDPAIGRRRLQAADGAFSRAAQPLTERESRLNPKYTFESFVIGAGNRFTHAAAVAVAEAPARAYNPLFIYGDSGLGKTHLLHAIGNYAGRLNPGLRTRYVSSEEFTNDFINSVRDDKMQAFQDRYRSVDVLLIDDIQFLERAERTQEEFFHTFNTLHNNNKQIVISSDKPPRDMRTLEERLRTRFEWGLISDVQAPDLETRIAILRKKAQADGMNLPPEAFEFIASRIQTNVRELEGALIRVTAFANLHRRAVDMNLTESVLRDLIGDADAAEITAADIMAVTADYFSVTVDDLTGSSRSRLLANARQMAMYLCRELTELSLPKIGEKFGGRDHTTVMHAYRKISTQMQEKMAIYNQIAELTSRIRTRARG